NLGSSEYSTQQLNQQSDTPTDEEIPRRCAMITRSATREAALKTNANVADIDGSTIAFQVGAHFRPSLGIISTIYASIFLTKMTALISGILHRRSQLIATLE
ncbi:hypothetical protein PMAYCL1PPCAC_27440, partial [Pristionchus mayeri]